MNPNKSCKICSHWDADTTTCRNRSPLAGVEIMWPVTKPDDWCKMFYAPKPKVPSEVDGTFKPTGRPALYSLSDITDSIDIRGEAKAASLSVISEATGINRGTLLGLIKRCSSISKCGAGYYMPEAAAPSEEV